MNEQNIIEITNLSKSFKDVKAVQDISFRVKKGELFAFLGINGAGKSSLTGVLRTEITNLGKIIDVDGAIVCPSFINGHIHIGDSIIKDEGYGLSLSEMVKPPNGVKHVALANASDDELVEAMRGSMWDMVNSGTTHFIDYREGGVKGVKLLKEASKDIPIKPIILGRDDSFYGEDPDLTKVKIAIRKLLKIADGIAGRTKQPDDFTIAPMIEKSMGNIDWNLTSKEIRNLIRGFNPMPGAYTTIDNQKMKIWKAEISNIENDENIIPGTIIEGNNKEGLFIKTGDGILNIIEIQMPNSKKMLAKDYFNGHTITKGSMCQM